MIGYVYANIRIIADISMKVYGKGPREWTHATLWCRLPEAYYFGRLNTVEISFICSLLMPSGVKPMHFASM